MYKPEELNLDYVDIMRVNDSVNLKVYLPQWKALRMQI